MRSAVPCCPHHPAGQRPPEPAAAAAPAPPGLGRQPSAGQSCPDSWCPPAGRGRGSVPGSWPPRWGCLGQEAGLRLACSGCRRSRSRARATLPRATSTTSLPGCSRSLFWARSLSNTTLREPGEGGVEGQWWPGQPCPNELPSLDALTFVLPGSPSYVQVGIFLRPVGHQAGGAKGPQLPTDQHTHVPVSENLQHSPNAAQCLKEERVGSQACLPGVSVMGMEVGVGDSQGPCHRSTPHGQPAAASPCQGHR